MYCKSILQLLVFFVQRMDRKEQTDVSKKSTAFLPFSVHCRVSDAMVEYYLIEYLFEELDKCRTAPSRRSEENNKPRRQERLAPQPRTTGPNPEKRHIVHRE